MRSKRPAFWKSLFCTKILSTGIVELRASNRFLSFHRSLPVISIGLPTFDPVLGFGRSFGHTLVMDHEEHTEIEPVVTKCIVYSS
jgi:hypothetical protein